MTPFGHIGSGLIIAGLAEKILPEEQFTPVGLGVVVLLSILPDLDGILAFVIKKWRPKKQMLKHHNYVTHTPVFYLGLAGLIWLTLGGLHAALFASLTLTHLFLDSWGTDDGIMWLWPFNRQQLSLFPTDLHSGGVFGPRYYARYVRCPQVIVPEALLFLGGAAFLAALWR